MIGTEFLNGQGLGNQLFCYVTARCIAQERGCAFGTANQEQLAVNIHSGRGMYFMDMDLGARLEYADPSASHHAGRPEMPVLKTPDGTVMTPYQERELRFYQGSSAHDLSNGCYVAGEDAALHELPDHTVIYGNMQDERYFAPYRDEIREWLRVKPEYDSHEFTRDNLCILNVRGGEYTGHPELYLRRQYWTDAMRNMRAIRPDMEFIISTDDPEAAAKLLPGLPVYHRKLDQDYTILKNARYLILSNSSFAFFPAYTSETLQYAIAPKYWARHNVSDGYWASEQNIYSIFHYQDRRGRLFTADECRAELEEYKRTSKRYARAGQRPQGAAARLAELSCRIRMTLYYAQRAWRSLCRRLGYKVPYARQ